MPTTITSAGITFNDATSLTSALVPTTSLTGTIAGTQIADGSVTAAKLGTNEQKQIAKAWFTYDGVADSLNKDYGILSVTRTATGRYTITFDSAFSDTNYCSVIGGQDQKMEIISRTTSSMNINILAGTTYNNSDYICIAIFA